MNRLLACILCCATLLPAAALAQEGRDEGDWHPNRPAPPRHAERAWFDHGRAEKAPMGHKKFSRTDFFVRGGYAVSTESNRWNGGYDGYGYYGNNGNDGGVAFEAGFRYWLTRELGIGLAAGYTDLGRSRNDGGIAVPVTSGGQPAVDGQYYDFRGTRLTAFPVTAQVTYRMPIHGPVRPYAELGAGVYTLRGPARDDRVYAMGVPTDTLGNVGMYGPGYGPGSSQSVHLGFLGGAGMEFRASRHVGVTLGARWNLVTANHESFDHATFLAGLVLR